MSTQEKFNDLPNISKNIENKFQSLNKHSKKNLDEVTPQKLKDISKMQCKIEIDQVDTNLSKENSKIKDSINQKKEEISKNIEKFLEKLENDTNEHIKNIENLNLTEKEKQEEYIECLEQLDNILALSESMKNCIEISEENLLNFLKQEISLDKDTISPFLKENEKDLNKNNIYNYLDDKQIYTEKIYNNLDKSNINNYIINSNLNEFKFKKIKINNYSDLSGVKNILLKTNSKDGFIQTQIKHITISNISKEDFNYLFNKKIKIKKKIRHFPSMGSREDFKIEKVAGKLSSTNLSRRAESEFIIIGEEKNEENDYIDVEFNYPNIYINNCNLTGIKLNDLFPYVKTLKLTSCTLSNDFYNLFEKESFKNMSELNLDNCNLINETFTEIIYAIIKNENLRLNLKSLSFKNNNLSNAGIYQYFMAGDIHKFRFENLEMLDLSYNDLDSLENKMMTGFPNIKVLDLSNNNFQFPSNFSSFYSRNEKNLKKKKTIKEESQKAGEIDEKMSNTEETPIEEEEINDGFLFLVSNNIALLKENHINTYLKYLIGILPKIDYPLKSINLSGLFYKSSCHHLISDINLKRFKNSLIEINLSNSNITDEEMANLFVNELRVINLKILNLANNKLTDEFFNLLVKNKSYDIYNKLKIINLSNNDIKLSNVKDVTNFAKLFDSIKIIIINNTQAEDNINNYIKKIVKRFNETQNGDKNKTELNDVDKLIQGLLEKNDKNNYLFNNSNIKLKMKNTIDYKFVEAAQKIYPELFDRIIIEYKYTGPN